MQLREVSWHQYSAAIREALVSAAKGGEPGSRYKYLVHTESALPASVTHIQAVNGS